MIQIHTLPKAEMMLSLRDHVQEDPALSGARPWNAK